MRTVPQTFLWGSLARDRKITASLGTRRRLPVRTRSKEYDGGARLRSEDRRSHSSYALSLGSRAYLSTAGRPGQRVETASQHGQISAPMPWRDDGHPVSGTDPAQPLPDVYAVDPANRTAPENPRGGIMVALRSSGRGRGQHPIGELNGLPNPWIGDRAYRRNRDSTAFVKCTAASL